MDTKQYWLIKSEPTTYGIEHLQKDTKTPWTGVRNFQARNFMRDGMQVGDLVLFYHSNCTVPGVYGIAKVASKPYADETQFDPQSDYYDPRATHEKPVWQLVDIAYVKTLPTPVPLEVIRGTPALAGMAILARGSRLSITPVKPAEYAAVIELANAAQCVLGSPGSSIARILHKA